MGIDACHYMKAHTASFLAYLKDRNFSPRTIERYERVLDGFVDHLGQLSEAELSDPRRITKSVVVSFLRSSGAKGAEPSGVVWNSRLACLRSFLGYLYREEQVDENPAAKVEFARVTPKEPVFLTAGEYAGLLDGIRQHGQPFYRDRDAAVTVVLFNTGVRVSELVSLDTDQVDCSNETFRAVKRKGGRVRDVYFNGEVARALQRWLRRRECMGVAECEGALFVSDRRQRLSARSVERLLSLYAERAGLGKKVTPHVLRHTTATELLRRGEDIRVVSEVLNHSNLNTTKRYTHLVEGAEKRAVDRLADL